MGLDYFNIELDNATAIFSPGDTISGKLNYRINKQLKFKQVIVAAIGEGYVHW